VDNPRAKPCPIRHMRPTPRIDPPTDGSLPGSTRRGGFTYRPDPPTRRRNSGGSIREVHPTRRVEPGSAPGPAGRAGKCGRPRGSIREVRPPTVHFPDRLAVAGSLTGPTRPHAAGIPAGRSVKCARPGGSIREKRHRPAGRSGKCATVRRVEPGSASGPAGRAGKCARLRGSVPEGSAPVGRVGREVGRVRRVEAGSAVTEEGRCGAACEMSDPGMAVGCRPIYLDVKKNRSEGKYLWPWPRSR
jgi:hypothetical protein